MAAPVMTRGLSRADQDQIRDAFTAGRRPKVIFTDAAGQIAGQTGQVVELADPASSDEWITVRFGKDELPFSPADLAIPAKAGGARGGSATKTTPTKTSPAKMNRGKATPAPSDPAPSNPGRAVPAKPARRTETTATDRTNPAPAKAAAQTPAAQKATVEQAAVERPAVQPTAKPALEQPAGVAPALEQPAAAPKPRPARAAKPPKPPASLVVTLSYAEREWTLAATQGTKSLAKPYLVSPADALRMVALIDVPGVQEAVENIIAAERADAETRAVKLRAELAELEARLAELTQHP